MLYLDLKDKGLDIYVICPGFVKTPMTDKNDFEMPSLISPEEAAGEIIKGLEKGEFEIHFQKALHACSSCCGTCRIRSISRRSNARQNYDALPEFMRLAEYWQTLTPAAVDAIATVYAEDAYFRDPFNEVTGIEKIRHIFADMFVRLNEPRFTILETIEQLNGSAGEGVRSAFMIWDFTFRINR